MVRLSHKKQEMLNFCRAWCYSDFFKQPLFYIVKRITWFKSFMFSIPLPSWSTLPPVLLLLICFVCKLFPRLNFCLCYNLHENILEVVTQSEGYQLQEVEGTLHQRQDGNQALKQKGVQVTSLLKISKENSM